MGSPFFEYKDYNDYMQRQGPFKKLPNTFWPAAKRMSEAFVCLFFYITLSLFFDLDYLKSDAYYE
ncbi:hypothetical protein COB52_00590 [Candidatus Kaiserbacteria bacterium]|nr:MAG: hypothetical protein COB52_00590 [Candidatus Kaiserbacteria bacterium]